MTTKYANQLPWRDHEAQEQRTGIFQYHFLLCTFQYILLHRVLCDESVHADMRFLPNAMGACHSLQVILRIPVALRNGAGVRNVYSMKLPMAHIKDNNRVGRLEIDA